MSAATVQSQLLTARDLAQQRHRMRLTICAGLLIVFVAGLLLYGLDYYTLDAAHRPHSPKHRLLRPSGPVGLRLGLLGFVLFLGLYLYPIRKRWPWLGKKGQTKHWLDVHVFLGVAAPCVIAFHSSFKFHGLAGVAFWIMMAVALSGIVGRYLYAQIPRTLGAAELSLQEMHEQLGSLTASLAEQRFFPPAQLETLGRLPEAGRVEAMSAPTALAWMLWLDLLRARQIAALRRRALPPAQRLATLGGLLPSAHAQLEQVISLARRRASLAKRVLFLTRAQRVFHLWHVVHRPFSYSFAVLSAIHIVVAMTFGLL
jgi:hypothetical protein